MAPVLRKRKTEKDKKTTPGGEEEGEMAVVDPVTLNKNRKIGWCKARRKAVEMSCIIADIIPQEVIFAILLLLPVDFIYHVVRYVCRGWYNIIRSPSFAYSHLHNSSSSNTSCLFLQCSFCNTPKSGYFLRTTNTGTIEFKRLGCVPHGIVMASCNGLLYFPKHGGFEACVLNPVTRQQVVLPLYKKVRPCTPYSNHFLAYAPVSGVYKIAQFISYIYNAAPRFAILTLGVDKEEWRCIDASHLDFPTNCIFFFPPLCIGRFMYYLSDPLGMAVVVCDIETETLWSISLPPTDWRNPGKFLALWGSLSMMVKLNSYLIETWLLIDPKIGRWEKLPDINLVGRRLRCHLMPIGCLGNGELLVFVESSEIIVYHVKMGRIVASYQSDDNDYPANVYTWSCHPHVDSLVSLSPATTTHLVEAYKKK